MSDFYATNWVPRFLPTRPMPAARRPSRGSRGEVNERMDDDQDLLPEALEATRACQRQLRPCGCPDCRRIQPEDYQTPVPITSWRPTSFEWSKCGCPACQEG